MHLYDFSLEYVQRLCGGDPDIEQHFSRYFGELLSLKLRSRLRLPSVIEDIRQETLLRVLETLREKGGIEHPERFGAFVNSVCNHVFMEHRRTQNRLEQVDAMEPADPHAGPDLRLVEHDLKRRILSTLDNLPERDREILRSVFLEEADKDEICGRHGVDPDYLRVLIHRAKARFRAEYLRKSGPGLK